jgi:hypothetical protein
MTLAYFVAEWMKKKKKFCNVENQVWQLLSQKNWNLSQKKKMNRLLQ